MGMATANAQGVGEVVDADGVVVAAQEVVDKVVLELFERLEFGDVDAVVTFHGEVVAIVDGKVAVVDVFEFLLAVFA